MSFPTPMVSQNNVLFQLLANLVGDTKTGFGQNYPHKIAFLNRTGRTFWLRPTAALSILTRNMPSALIQQALVAILYIAFERSSKAPPQSQRRAAMSWAKME